MAKLLCLARFEYTFFVLLRQEFCYNISRYYRLCILFNFEDNALSGGADDFLDTHTYPPSVF